MPSTAPLMPISFTMASSAVCANAANAHTANPRVQTSHDVIRRDKARTPPVPTCALQAVTACPLYSYQYQTHSRSLAQLELGSKRSNGSCDSCCALANVHDDTSQRSSGVMPPVCSVVETTGTGTIRKLPRSSLCPRLITTPAVCTTVKS